MAQLQATIQDVAGVAHVSKTFGTITALRDVSLSFRRGEIHGLVGANGAGKSTLVKVLAGVHQPDEGEVLIGGSPIRLAGPLDARRRGLGFIFQELSLVPKFSILRNLCLGQWETTKLGLLNWRPQRQRAQMALERIGLARSLETPVGELSVAEAWLVTIARTLMYEAELIFMDEPTASLSAEESARLFNVIGGLSADGVAIAYISHRLNEVVELCSRVSVFRDGALVQTLDGDRITQGALIEGIIGSGRSRAATETIWAPTTRSNVATLRVSGLRRAPMVRGIDLEVYAGEVVGLAGLVGSGRTEFARLVFGAERPESGAMELDGKPFAPKNVHAAIARGVGLVPEERRSQGLILDRSVSMNINLAFLRRLRTAFLGLLSTARARQLATAMIGKLVIKTPSAQVPVRQLSGGNQQKVVMAKWLVGEVRLLILDEPSRGVDVAARAEIYRLIRQQAEAGTAVLVISSEFDELKACDRVAVMREGAIVGYLDHGDISEPAILKLCFAGGPSDPKEAR